MRTITILLLAFLTFPAMAGEIAGCAVNGDHDRAVPPLPGRAFA